MKVDVAREYFMFDANTKRLLGKGYPYGMSIMAFATLFLATILFFVVFLPAIFNFGGLFDLIPLLIVPLLFALSIYMYYDIVSNYLYYKGKWRDPPFAKRSVKVFWRDLKRGKIRALILWGGGKKSMDFHIIYQGLGNRGVVVKISKEEKLGMDKFLKERIEKGAKRVVFEYEGVRVKDAIIEYEDGKKERVGKEKAELMRFFYVLSKDKLASAGLYACKMMKKLVDG